MVFGSIRSAFGPARAPVAPGVVRVIAVCLLSAVMVVSGIEVHAHIHQVTDPSTPHNLPAVFVSAQLAVGLIGAVLIVLVIGLPARRIAPARSARIVADPRVRPRHTRSPPVPVH